ncbi:MAG: S-layer homology domain-containing protein [Oscillospiraceae bacterium]|nr:S-layer homology domain-containing protein [Oscillospiraceae bacterium]
MEKTGKNGIRILRLALELLLIAALVFVLVRDAQQRRRDAAERAVSVSWYMPDGEVRQDSLPQGSLLTLPEAEALDGYTFIGWRDSRGNLEERRQLTVYEDCAYAAVYAMALETDEHVPYLDLGEGGLFHPKEALTRRDAAVMLYRLLHTDLVGSGTFADVAEDDPCFAAAATLKTLGVVDGSRFHPDEAITRGELLQMLAALYPAAEQSYEYSDQRSGDAYYPAFCLAMERGWIDKADAADPDGLITRAETARLMNRLLGRSDAIDDPTSMVGTILDLSFRDPDFRDAAEASIPHESDGDRWTESEPLPVRDPGFFFVGGRLHCIDEDGSPLTNTELGALSFNANGEVSSGDAALDALLVQAIQTQVGQPKYKNMEQLKLLFNYVVEHFTYLRRSMYESGETGWEAEEAYVMLTTGKGNCYNYAALFGEFARFLGFDAKIYSGTVYQRDADLDTVEGNRHKARTPHAWVEIEIDGENRLFDAEYQYAFFGNGDAANFFNRGSGTYKQFGYLY